MNLDTNELNRMITETLAYAGINPTRVVFLKKDIGFSSQRMYTICVDFDFGVTELLSYKHVTDALKPQIDGILESELIKSYTDKSEKRILELENKCLELEKLVQFKNHFELEMKLRHGDKP